MREKRGQGDSITYKNLAAEQRIRQFRNFLQNGQNKNSLIKFIVDHWGKTSSRAKGKEICVTSGNLGYKLNIQSVQEVEELQSEQEEAHVRLLLHAKYSSKPHFKAIVVSSEYTDVSVFCVVFAMAITVPLANDVCCSTLQDTSIYERYLTQLEKTDAWPFQCYMPIRAVTQYVHLQSSEKFNL